jgi:septal ring factor EnvC (AmiA/AmiB activator)
LVKRRVAIALSLTAASAGALPAADPSPMPATAVDVESVLERVGTENREVQGRLDELATEATRVHALLLVRARSYVKMARAGLLPVGGGLDALVDHASRLERLRRALSTDLEREQKISSERVLLAKRKESLEDRRAMLEQEHTALARSHAAILAAEERESAFRRAFSGGHDAFDHTAVYASGLGPMEPGDVSTGFAALKGRLPFPVEGRAEIKQVKLPSSDGPGLRMASVNEGAVRAVFAGRVAFADTYADYGRTVILDHGSGYYTVSANLSSIDVKVGQELRAGARLGTAGGAGEGSALYLEIRHGARTVSPAAWFGI